MTDPNRCHHPLITQLTYNLKNNLATTFGCNQENKKKTGGK
jgi:hypothetical protein